MGHLPAVDKIMAFQHHREILDEINAVVGGESSSPKRGGDSKDSDEEESSHDDFEVVNSQFDPTTDLPTTSPRHGPPYFGSQPLIFRVIESSCSNQWKYIILHV